MAKTIEDSYKVGPLTFPKTFQCDDSGSELKVEVTKLLEKHEIKTWRVTVKYKHTYTAFVKALNKVLAEQLSKVQDAQELNDTEKYTGSDKRHKENLKNERRLMICTPILFVI